MVKVKALQRFNDVAAKKGTQNTIREKGDEFEVDEKRAKHLKEQKMVEIVQAASEKKTNKTA